MKERFFLLTEPNVIYHISKDGYNAFCGTTYKETANIIHWHYYPRELDEGSWCPKCQAEWAKNSEVQACQP